MSQNIVNRLYKINLNIFYFIFLFELYIFIIENPLNKKELYTFL